MMWDKTTNGIRKTNEELARLRELGKYHEFPSIESEYEDLSK